jgi:hypothetical protein
MPGPIEDQPALNVKIENSPEARPQTGVEDADIVWEEIVEGGIPRWVVVWHSKLPDEIGPIRSIRPMDGGIAGPTHGLMVFSGGKSPFIQKAVDAKLQTLSQDSGDPGFYRVNTRPAPHNVYADPKDFIEQADKKHSASPPGEFLFAPTAAEASAATAGKVAGSIALTMSGGSHPNWAWDSATSTWLRSEGDNPAMAASETQLFASNVVTIKVEVGWAEGTDPAGNPIPETMIVGEGDGFVASGGKILDVKWSKKSTTDPVVLTTVAGASVKLAPGNTWVELMPIADGAWEVDSK